jgi:hypothetical protein
MGDVIVGWMLLWRACVASEKLVPEAKIKDEIFYRGQIKTAEFFIQTVLPCTMGKMESIAKMSPAAIEMEDAWFGN